MKRLLVLALFLALGVTATACTDSTGPGDSLAGTYTLRSINGATAFPILVYQDADVSSEVVSAQIVLDAAGNYQGTTRWRDTYFGTQPQVSDESSIGIWTLSGSQIALTDRDYPNDPYYGTVSGGTITLTDFTTGVGYTLVYSK